MRSHSTYLVFALLAGCDAQTSKGTQPDAAGGNTLTDGSSSADEATSTGDLAAITGDLASVRPDLTGVMQGTPGTWENVSLTGGDISGQQYSCGNYGSLSVVINPNQPADVYTEINCQGIWKSSDYGLTWRGPINTGMNAAAVSDCAGGIAIAQDGTLFESCIRGSGTGFWKSTDDGVDWTRYTIAPSGDRQDVYPPYIDPYDPKHLLMCGHEQSWAVESTDGGETWTFIAVNSAMNTTGGTNAIMFVNTGNAATTRKTWLFLPQGTGGQIGTWRTSDGGGSWKQVDTNEKEHSYSQLFQPDTKGVIYMAGEYSKLGWGVLRSTDYGQTWAHVGNTGNEDFVFGTPKHVYSLDSGVGNFQIGDANGMSWISATAPAGSVPGGDPAGSVSAAVTNDGTHNILFAADWNSGVWRYVEPTD